MNDVKVHNEESKSKKIFNVDFPDMLIHMAFFNNSNKPQLDIHMGNDCTAHNQQCEFLHPLTDLTCHLWRGCNQSQ